MMSHFILGLRQIDINQAQPPSHFSKFTFSGFHIPNSITGNIGEMLRTAQDDENEMAALYVRLHPKKLAL